MRARTRTLLRRLAELPAVVVDHLLGPDDLGDPQASSRERDPAGAEAPDAATVRVEHRVRVGPFLRQFGGACPEDDDEGGPALH